MMAVSRGSSQNVHTFCYCSGLGLQHAAPSATFPLHPRGCDPAGDQPRMLAPTSLHIQLVLSVPPKHFPALPLPFPDCFL